MGQFNLENQTGTITKDKSQIKEPKMYKVILHNDDYTTMEFVVIILKKVFHKSTEESYRIMYEVHYNGIGIAGIYTFEIAETKAASVQQLASKKEFPLRCTIEPE